MFSHVYMTEKLFDKKYYIVQGHVWNDWLAVKINRLTECMFNNQKVSTIQEQIVTEKLDTFTVVETSYVSFNSPGLISSTPTSYTYFKKARPPPPCALNQQGPRGGESASFTKNS